MVKLHRNNLILLCLVLMVFVREVWDCAQSWASYTPVLGKTSLSSQFSMIYEFFHWFGGNRHDFHPCVSTRAFPSILLHSFPPALGGSFHACAAHYLEEFAGNPLQSWGFFSVCSTYFWYSYWHCSYLGLPGLLALPRLSSAGVSSHMPRPKTCKGVSPGRCVAHLICLLSPGDHPSSLCHVQFLENLCFLNFIWVCFGCFKWRSKSSLC